MERGRGWPVGWWRGRKQDLLKTWEEYPEDDRESPEARARRGRWRLVVAVALFATLILPRVLSSADDTAGVPAGPRAAPSPMESGAGTVTGTPVPSGGPVPSSAPRTDGAAGASPPARGASPSAGETSAGESSGGNPSAEGPSVAGPVAHAFRSVRAGQCLSVHRDARDGDGWSAASPSAAARTGCAEPDAYVRVTAVRADAADCPRGPDRDHWSHHSARGAVALCLTRQLRTGDCLLASTQDQRVRADLMSAPDCGTRRLPRPYDRVLTVTGVHPGVPDPAPAGLCARDEGQRGDGKREHGGREHGQRGANDQRTYWTWRVASGHTVVCTLPSRVSAS